MPPSNAAVAAAAAAAANAAARRARLRARTIDLQQQEEAIEEVERDGEGEAEGAAEGEEGVEDDGVTIEPGNFLLKMAIFLARTLSSSFLSQQDLNPKHWSPTNL